MKLFFKYLALLLIVSCLIPKSLYCEIKVGSKKFTESVILGELAVQLIQSNGKDVQHLRELGGTRVLWNALLRGDVDVYPEYTGTIYQEIFSEQNITSTVELKKILKNLGIGMSKPLGFNNTYAIGMMPAKVNALNIKEISDLVNYPDLHFGFTNEFMDRSDGWPGIRQYYKLPQNNVTGLDHDLAYRALASESIDVTDLYTTDAEIEYYNLFILVDDKDYFSEYLAVYLYRLDLKIENSKFPDSIARLEGKITQEDMIRMNLKAKMKGIPESQVASDFLASKFNIHSEIEKITFFRRLKYNTWQHIILVIISLTAAIILSIPLGIISVRKEKTGQIILATVGVIQTIPSLALLVFMIPLLGIGAKPAIFALFLYSLLPIVRNTHSGLKDIPVPLLESADALGLSPFSRLRLIEIPLALRSILSGIKTSAVINVGTATLGALIGAGGFGQPILTGIRLDDISLILEGAIPAAMLAISVQGFFDILEIIIVPKGLRLKNEV